MTKYAVENDIQIIGSVDVNTNITNNDDNDNTYNKDQTNIITSRNKITETFVLGTIFVPNRKVSEQLIAKAIGSNLPVLVEKQAYSCFQNPNMDAIVKILTERSNENNFGDNNITTVVVYGVATEYCVKEAVLGLLSRGIKVLLVRDAIGAINESAGISAIKEMMDAGAGLVEAEEVVNVIEIINA